MRTIYAGQDSMARYDELLQRAEALWQRERGPKGASPGGQNMKLPKLEVDELFGVEATFVERVACKIVAEKLLNMSINSVQCSGKKNWDIEGGKADIQMPISQLVQIVLRLGGGYAVCESDVIKWQESIA